ncbi:hypothetical protein LR48_Vigan10g051100 [Vigna angularis]|uniref:TIR domain-containing protein n=1 Tax=Phaseolus angularis TaxID=3914 RepID=A0A0L9VIS5_PHAAN|nr:hypothetical protein LR48_Vigan10g051100 [Vigna angularis]
MELSSSLRNYTHSYDVFLSFRGVDTRTGFTGHLYSALCQRGILTFMDDDALSKGEEITPSLLNAIRKCRIAIVIFSKNYASSTFCLNELVQILACHTSKENTWIWPVFYDVDPSEVRHQTGSYAEAFEKYEQERFKNDQEKVQKWRLALHQAADFSGWHFKHGGEYEHVIIKRILEKISCKINRPLLQIADYPVGLEARMRYENDEILAMLLDMPKDEEVQWNGEVFGKLKNLRMLIKKNGPFQSSPKHFPNSLRVLEWMGYPVTSLPSNVASKNLVILNLSYSFFRWDKPLQKSKVLSQLIFTGCKNIREIPDVSGSPNLTELCVDDCMNLIQIDDSVGFLDKLLRFSAKGCTKLRIVPHGIKLTSLEYLCLRDCRSLAVFPEILAPMEKLKFVDLEGTAIENLPLSFNNLKGLQSIHLNRCKRLENNALSNIIQMLPNFFPFLKTLRLRNSNLSILPECIQECHFLELLDLCYCKQLREIRGLPPNIDDFLAYNCKSLEAHSSTLNSLLSRAIDSSTRKFYVLPGERVPEWFDHSTKGNSLCFWFRRDFPSITVCAILGVLDNIEGPFFVKFNFFVTINDIEIPFLFDFNYILDTDHMFMFNNFTYPMKLDCGGLVSENEWSYGEVLFVIPPNSGSSGSIKSSGVYVNRTCTTTMENVRFSNPYPPNTTFPTDHGTRNQLDIQQDSFDPVVSMHTRMLDKLAYLSTRQWRRPFMYPEWKEPLDNVLSPNLSESDLSDVIGQVEEISSDLSDVIGQIEEISSEMEEVPLHNPYPSETVHDSHCSTCHENEVFRKLVDCRIKSSRSNLHLGTSSTVFPTKNEPSVRNQIEQTQEDHEEMDTFYASLGAKSHVSHSRHKTATNVLSKMTREALKIVEDFISDDALVLLHPERFSIVKNSLAYLSTLSADDGMSIAMEALISEALGKFTHWRRDYTEASMKIETTASELQRADELEAGLESNKNQYVEVMALENELHQKLSWMEKRKESLEEEIKAIEANIAASEIEKGMIHQRKRNIFEEGKTLKTQRDELMEKSPYLQQEHSLAMEKQTRIKVEC